MLKGDLTLSHQELDKLTVIKSLHTGRIRQHENPVNLTTADNMRGTHYTHTRRVMGDIRASLVPRFCLLLLWIQSIKGASLVWTLPKTTQTRKRSHSKRALYTP